MASTVFFRPLRFNLFSVIHKLWASLVVQMVENLPAMRETWVPSLGREGPLEKEMKILEKEMATHSRTIAWKIPGTEEPGRVQSMGSQRVGQD